MNWHQFVAKLAKEGYTGSPDDFEAVQAWLRENGHNETQVRSKGGKIIELKQLYDDRPGKFLDVSDVAEHAEFEARIEEAVERKVAVLKDTMQIEPRRPPHVRVKDMLEEDPCLGYRKYEECGLGQWLFDLAIQTKAIKEGRPSQAPERFLKSQQILGERQKQLGLQEGDDALGGFLAPTQHRAEILKHMWEVGRVFTRARQIQMTSRSVDIPTVAETSRADGSRQGGVRSYWVGEGLTITDSRPSFGKVTLNAHKLAVLGYLTAELEEDSIVPQLQLLGDMFAEELAFGLDDSFIRGSGSGRPLGMLNAPATVSVTRNTASSFIGIDAVNMWARLPIRSKRSTGLAFFCNSEVMAHVVRLAVLPVTGGAGDMVPLFQSYREAPGEIRILGIPVVEVEQTSDLGTLGDVILADMQEYLMGSRRGVETQQSIHLQFLTDQIAFKATLRSDGQPWWQSAVTPYQATDPLSPFVQLS